MFDLKSYSTEYSGKTIMTVPTNDGPNCTYINTENMKNS